MLPFWSQNLGYLSYSLWPINSHILLSLYCDLYCFIDRVCWVYLIGPSMLVLLKDLLLLKGQCCRIPFQLRSHVVLKYVNLVRQIPFFLKTKVAGKKSISIFVLYKRIYSNQKPPSSTLWNWMVEYFVFNW
jgi:hypothetical protein